MTVRTETSKGYRIRFGIIAIALLAFSAYCFYDGAVAYPHQKEIYETYISLRASGNVNWASEWEKKAAEFGVAAEAPKERSQNDIYTQYGMGAIVLVGGVLFAGYWFAIGGRFVEADDEGLADNKVKVKWDSLKSVDNSRWESKGIAVVHYQNEKAKGRIVLDDWKFDRDSTLDIHKLVAEHLGQDAGNEDESEAEA